MLSFPGISDLTGAFGTGVARITNWIFTMHKGTSSQEAALSLRYPDMPAAEIDKLRSWMLRSRIAGQALTKKFLPQLPVGDFPAVGAGESYYLYDLLSFVENSQTGQQKAVRSIIRSQKPLDVGELQQEYLSKRQAELDYYKNLKSGKYAGFDWTSAPPAVLAAWIEI